MKQTLLITFMLCAALTGRAQQVYEPMVSEDKEWKMQYQAVVAPEYGILYSYSEMRLQGDKEMDNIHFKGIYEKSYRQDEPIPDEWKFTNQWIGEDNGKVYVHSSGRNYLVMDFSLNVGESIPGSSEGNVFPPYYVTAVTDTILPNSTDKRPRKCLYVEFGGDPHTRDVWIEGIGSLKYGITGALKTYLMGDTPELYSCSRGDDVLYLSASATAGIVPIKSDASASAADAPLYDLQGRRLTAKPQRGVYVQGGRKYVVK